MKNENNLKMGEATQKIAKRYRSDGTEIVDTRNHYQKLFDEKYHAKAAEHLKRAKEERLQYQLPRERNNAKPIFRTKTTIEVSSENGVAKPLPKMRKVYAPDGKSMWYEEVK